MSKLIDLTGRIFGRLAVQKRFEDHITSGGNVVVIWGCICSCGKSVSVSSNSLLRNKTKSCGCLLSELAAIKGRLNRTHGGYSQLSNVVERVKFQALVNIRERSRHRGYESDLDIADLPILTDSCPVLGIKYSKGSLKNKDFVPSVDRKNSNLPYLKKYKDNLVFISHRANRIKSDATIEELQKILQYLQKDCNG